VKCFRAIAVLLCLLLPLQAAASLALTGCAGEMAMTQATSITGSDCHSSQQTMPEQSMAHDCCSDTDGSEGCSHCELCLQTAPAAMVTRLLSASNALGHAMQAPALRLVLSEFPFSLLRPPQTTSRLI
jgi:hypothetical protein